MNGIMTKYGTLVGITSNEVYMNGQIKACTLDKENQIKTDYGVFIPQYSAFVGESNRVKKHRPSACFYENGSVKSIALESQTSITTPIGEFLAELVTFHKSGKLNRVFPLNGQINGFWSEEDEETLCETYNFSLPFASFEAKIIGLRFYETGEVNSITLWPGETINVTTKQGQMLTRVGVSLYKNGQLKSIEPADKILVKTPIGYVTAHDNNVIGIHGDDNSLKFDENGEVSAITTYTNSLVVTHSNGRVMVLDPEEVPSYVDISETMILPLKLAFDEEYVTVLGRKSFRFSLKDHKFKIKNNEYTKLFCSGMCDSCSSCRT